MLVIHSVVRWLVVIAGIVVVVKFLLGWLQKQPFTRLDKNLSTIFSVSFDVQILIGIITLITLSLSEGFKVIYILHTVIMLLAMLSVHLPMRWRKAEPALRFRNTLISFLAALILIGIGVAIVGGWSRLIAA